MSIKLMRPGVDITVFDDAAVREGVYGNITVPDVGSKLGYEIINNNTIRVLDGLVMARGFALQIPDYEDFTIENGTQGMAKHIVIGLQFTAGAEENAGQYVTNGVSSWEVPENDVWGGDNEVKVPLYRVTLDGLNISSIAPLFSESKTLPELEELINGLKENMMTNTVNGWRVIRHPDGWKEMYYSYSVNSAVADSWGMLYRSPVFQGVEFPEAFTSAPYIFITVQGNGEDAATLALTTACTKTKAPNFILTRGNALSASKNWIINIHAYGQ